MNEWDLWPCSSRCRFSSIFTQALKFIFPSDSAIVCAMEGTHLRLVIVKSLLIFFISLFDAFYSVNGKSSFKAKWGDCTASGSMGCLNFHTISSENLSLFWNFPETLRFLLTVVKTPGQTHLEYTKVITSNAVAFFHIRFALRTIFVVAFSYLMSS